ncbi:MAG: thiamine diphosphokinase [Balneolales bacterium]|nr:thiamine diphosphokinase [Balneolales bacterium]
MANGRPPSQKNLSKAVKWADITIAADGGISALLKYGIMPDYLIGDLDSAANEINTCKSAGAEVITDEDQETNDLEKALKLARKLNATDVIVLGGTGYRIDHTLKNLSVIQQFSDAFSELRLTDDYCTTRVITSPFYCTMHKGEVVSLFPLSGIVKNITSRGLKYCLNNESLENGKRDGSSNEALGGPVEIVFGEGCLLFITEATWPLD